MTMRDHGREIHRIVEQSIVEESEHAQAQIDAARICAALLRDEAKGRVGEYVFALASVVFAIVVGVLIILGLDRVMGVFL